MHFKHNNSKILRLILISFVVIFIQICITVKHPGSHYLVPSIALAVYVNAVIAYLFFSDFKSKKLFNLFIIIIIAAIGYNGYRLTGWFYAKQNYNEKVRLLLNAVDSMPDSIKVGFYRSSLPSYALVFGNSFSGTFCGALMGVYPDVVSYNIWYKQFYSFGSLLDKKYILSQLNSGKSFILVGYNDHMASLKELICEKVYDNGIEGIYRLRGIRND